MRRAHTGKEIRVEWGETGKREREQVEKNRVAQGHGGTYGAEQLENKNKIENKNQTPKKGVRPLGHRTKEYPSDTIEEKTRTFFPKSGFLS